MSNVITLRRSKSKAAPIYTSPEEAEMLAGDALSSRFAFTIFPDTKARTMRAKRADLIALAKLVAGTTADRKEALPLVNLGRFGDARSPKGALRHGGNLKAVHGLEADYDAGDMSPEEAAQRLAEARVAALVYTSPSHGLPGKGHRWRVLCPFSGALPPEERERHVARVNGVLGGVLAGESFALSQSYFIGGVKGREPDTFLVDGDHIDTRHDLDAGALAKGTAKGGETTRDDSQSGVAFRFLMDRFAEGMGEEEARDEIAQDDGDAGAWWAKVDSRQKDRAVTKAQAKERERGAEVIDLFDHLDDDGDSIAQGADDDFELDEDGVIRAFTAAHKDELRFDHAAGSWFRFDGNSWRREETKLAHHYARQLATSMADDDPKAKPLRKVHVWEAIERGARTVREFVATSADWNRDPWLLGTPRGTVDLRTGVLRDGDPADHICRLTAAPPVPLERFDPARDCPRWMAFLDEALGGDPEAIRFLRMWGGYCLTGETKEHALVFVYGRGGSGKSTTINTMADILGEYAINVATSTLTAAKHDAHPEEIARLDGARLAWASETEKGRAWAENRIKALTGGDKITARFMRQNSFEFTPQMKLVIVGNNAPSLTSVDEAVKRRFIILPFDHPPMQKDPDLPAKLKAEWSGILSWMIGGCLDWQANGLFRPEVARRATEAYFAEQDVFAKWIEECCQTGKHVADTTANLWESWSAFAFDNGEQPGTKARTFPETLTQRGFEPVKDTLGIRGRGWRGLRVASEDFSDDFEVL